MNHILARGSRCIEREKRPARFVSSSFGYWLHHTLRLSGDDRSSHLNASFRELCPLGELFSCVDVRVLRPFEGLFKLVQLVRGEGRP